MTKKGPARSGLSSPLIQIGLWSPSLSRIFGFMFPLAKSALPSALHRLGYLLLATLKFTSPKGLSPTTLIATMDLRFLFFITFIALKASSGG